MKPSTLLPVLSLISSSAAHHSPRAAHSHNLTHAPIPSIPGPTFRLPGSKSAFTSPSASAAAPESQKAGARLEGSNITSVSATFQIPSAEMPTTGPTADNQNGVYQASYWVGLDGVTAASCGGGVSLRGGVDTFWDTGMRTTGAWWEWYPNEGPSQFGNFTVQQGDVVRITTTADGDGMGGEVKVEKLDGPGCGAEVLASASHRFEGEAGARLCLGEAAVVIEDYPIQDRPDYPLPFANFTEVVFGEIKVNGKAAEGLEVFDINLEAQGGRLTDCEVEAGSVDCKRVVGDA
jgi:hypothetical protein